MSFWIFLAEDYLSPFRAKHIIWEKLLYGIEIIILSFEFAWFSDIDGRTGELSLHKRKLEVFIKVLLSITLHLYLDVFLPFLLPLLFL